VRGQPYRDLAPAHQQVWVVVQCLRAAGHLTHKIGSGIVSFVTEEGNNLF
jgi:hypothetical protein